MAYVRRRGNQVAIVHGRRCPKTRKVEQLNLFTFYTRAEAEHALGEGSTLLQSLLEHNNPQVRFDWPRIAGQLATHVESLPASYTYREERMESEFDDAMHAFLHQLFVVDPQSLHDCATLISDRADVLEELRDLIDWRLYTSEQEPTPYNQDNTFHWRFRSMRRELPIYALERVGGLMERREHGRAHALIEALLLRFPDYADGHNNLGWIALYEGRLDNARDHFERAIDAGRALFPKRIAKRDYWTDHDTRPYLRGILGLVETLDRLGYDEEALAWCDRLERQFGMADAAQTARASLHLNAARWQAAADSAHAMAELFPEQAFIEAFALFELGRDRDAAARFLYAALNRPLTAALLTGEDAVPEDYNEQQDHDAGRELLSRLARFEHGRTDESRWFFDVLVQQEAVAAVLDEARHVARRHGRVKQAAHRQNFVRMQTLHSASYAAELAGTLTVPPHP